MDQELLELVTAREGHFRLESGHHGRLWLDLDSLFMDPVRIRPFVDALAEALRPYDPEAVCGPLVGGAFLAQGLAGRLGTEFLFTERAQSKDERLYGARYRLPGALVERIRGRRIAIVDDAISAGSAVRGTYHEVRGLGARPVVVGALMILGSSALPFFEERRVPVQSVGRFAYDLWTPAACPLCVAGAPLEDPVRDGTQEVKP